MYNPIKPYKHQILKLIESTWDTPYVRVRRGVYPIIERKFSYPEVDHTDGIGTKGFYHWRASSFRSAVVDALAMNLNDLALVRATPYKLSNHITVPKEDERVFKIVQAMVVECRKRNIAMVGGENSFHNNMDGLDISMTVTGYIKDIVPNMCRKGDILIGLKSRGIHSNGITKVRKIFGNAMRKEFTTPTAIYLEEVLSVTDKFTVHGMMHITGGAFTKLKDIVKNADIEIDHTKVLPPQKIFYEMYKKGLPNKTMYSTFNCGIGFVLSVPPEESAHVLRALKSQAAVIGRIIGGTGEMHIKSAFDGRVVKF